MLVVGGGVAACVAADAVLSEGKSVTMIFPNGGNSEVSGGAVDIMGVVPGENPRICESYKEGIEALLEKYPGHVYGKCKDELENGIDALVSLAEAGGYPFVGHEGKNVWVPNMLGTFTVNAYVPKTMEDSVMTPGKKEKVLVVGVKGNVAFNAGAAAMSYKQYQKKIGGAADYYSTEIELEGWGDRRKISDGELADYVDTAAGKDELIKAVKTFCMNNRYKFDKILFPPALGYIHYLSVIAEIKEACGCAVGEVQTLGNSVVGYRFTRALYRGLEKKGAQLLRGAKVDSINVDEAQAEAECTVGLTDQLHPGEKECLSAPAMILATGGFVGGGIKARKTEVWIELLDKNLGTVPAEKLDRNAVSGAGQDFIRLGVEVNDDMSVADEKYKGQLFACGNVLAGHNFASERSSVGIAAASGYLAGKKAASKK